jgi:drug/metabolite transporter (DMT)-like permease
MRNDSLVISPYSRLTDNSPLLLFFLLAVDSLHFVFARLLLPHLPPTTSAMYVLAVATAEVTLFLLIWDEIRFDLLRRYIWYFLAIGFLVAASTALNYTAVAYIDPGIASLLAKTTVLFSLGFGVVWLGDRLTLWQSVGALVAIIGVFVISFQPGDYLRVGSLLVVGSTLIYALHAVLVKRQSEKIRLAEFFLFRLLCTTAFLAIFAAGRQELLWPGAQTWLILLLVGTVDITISRGLYYIALRRLNLSVHAIILTLSPVMTVLWTVLLFGIVPTLQQSLGGLAVILGVLIVSVGKLRHTPSNQN